MEITKKRILNISEINDHDIDLFEGQYDVPNGMAYNSYVILDDKDRCDGHGRRTASARRVACDRLTRDAWQADSPDYLVVQHMEPDHSANIVQLHAGLSRHTNGGGVSGQGLHA